LSTPSALTGPVRAGSPISGAVTEWLSAEPKRWLAGIRHVVIDPYQPYATAVAKGLPSARLVVDHLDVIRLATSQQYDPATPASARRARVHPPFARPDRGSLRRQL
jgi:hypothetical protein